MEEEGLVWRAGPSPAGRAFPRRPHDHFLSPLPLALAILPPLARDAGDSTDNATSPITAASVDALTGAFVEGGRGFGRTGVGGYATPGGDVRGGSVTVGLPLPISAGTSGTSAGGSDTPSIVQIDRNGIHVGRRGNESLLDVPLPCWFSGTCSAQDAGVVGRRKEGPRAQGND